MSVDLKFIIHAEIITNGKYKCDTSYQIKNFSLLKPNDTREIMRHLRPIIDNHMFRRFSVLTQAFF